ncbi:MAG: extracellular solute-binding protein [Anaerolineaceae bacterium]
MKSVKNLLFFLVITAMVLSACAPTQPVATTVPIATDEATAVTVTESAAPTENSLAGTTITVLLPPWGEIPAAQLAEFENSTGIKVDMQVSGWDEIHDKIAVAAVANTAVADVVEVDWSWVGEFKNTGWFVPLNSFVTDDMKQDIPLIGTFTAGENILALPYSNDFRIGTYNKDHFTKAGITEAPTTWDELIADMIKIKESGVAEYPLGFPLSVSEGTTTNFILMTISRSGVLFNEDGTLNEANALATFQLINDGVNVQKIIDPNNLVMTDQEINTQFFQGKQSIVFGGPNMYDDANNPDKSTIVGNVSRFLIPGRNEVRSTTFGLPEGIGIPSSSKNQEAAWKFIEWAVSPQGAKAYADTQGLLPPRTSVFSDYVSQDKYAEGDVLLEQIKYNGTFAPQSGTPSWYPKFSLAVQDAVNKVAGGTMTPEDAVASLSETVKSLLAQ